MTVGTIVHELLQRTLRNKLVNMPDIVAAGRELLNSKDMAQTLYACKMSRVEAAKEVEPFYPKIYDFIKNHVHLPSKVNEDYIYYRSHTISDALFSEIHSHKDGHTNFRDN